MARYARRRTSRASSRYSSRSAPRTRRRASSSGRRRSRVSGGARTIRLVIQTVQGGGANAAGQSAALPMRAMF